MKLTEKQQQRIWDVLNNYRIDIITRDSRYNNIQEISFEYFFEKINEALEEVEE